MDFLHHVHPVHDQGSLPGHAESDVQHRSVLGHVDVLAGEHGVTLFLQG